MPKFYVTTSIAYTNGPPHIGFALESVEADAIARYRRQQGDDVFFLTGTDEHGAKIARAAAVAGKSPQEFVDEISDKYKELKGLLNLSWDDFIRTSDQKKHWPNVVTFWNKLVEADDIYKKKYQGLYCVGHEAFVTEKDLDNGVCRDHNQKPEVVEEENYFFRLSKYADEIKKKIKSDELKIYPQSRANETLSFIKDGLEDVSFSRPRKDLDWGVPVPGDDSQIIYVWADALVNYLYPKDQWPADLHIIGKDIFRFHTLFWPGMLLSVGLPLPKEILIHGFITSEGRKMSKTVGNVIDPFVLVEEYGTDAVRYYLLREISPFEDGDFSKRRFEELYNADLANGLGNFAARVGALSRIKNKNIEARLTDKGVKSFIELTEKAVAQKMEEYKLNEALEAIWELIKFGDGYLNQNKPWEFGDEKAISNVVAILEKLGELLEPFLSETAEKIKKGDIDKLFPRL